MSVPHRWVKHTITNVSVLPDLENDAEVVVIEDPDSIQAAEDGAVYGCDRCGVPLPGNTDSMCPVDPLCHCGMELSLHTVSTGHDFVEVP